MITRTGLLVICYLMLNLTTLFCQDQVIEVIEHAKLSYLHQDYQETVNLLSKAMEQLNEKLIDILKTSFPDPIGGWRAEDAKGLVTNVASLKGLNVKRSYYKKGGGSSVDIKIETNSIKIGNIRAMLSSPAMLKRAGENLKIETVADHRCIQRFDPIDRYAELIFVPTSTLMITIVGQDMKNTNIVSEYAEKINWSELEIKFP